MGACNFMVMRQWRWTWSVLTFKGQMLQAVWDFIVARRSPSGAVLLGGIVYWRLESYCGRMGSGCRVVFGSIWGGMVYVFSVVAGWFVEYSESLNAMLVYLEGLARYLERCGWWLVA